MKGITIVVKVAQALIKPITQLIGDLEDGKISKEEAQELILEISLSVASVISELLGKD